MCVLANFAYLIIKFVSGIYSNKAPGGEKINNSFVENQRYKRHVKDFYCWVLLTHLMDDSVHYLLKLPKGILGNWMPSACKDYASEKFKSMNFCYEEKPLYALYTHNNELKWL